MDYETSNDQLIKIHYVNQQGKKTPGNIRIVLSQLQVNKLHYEHLR